MEELSSLGGASLNRHGLLTGEQGLGATAPAEASGCEQPDAPAPMVDGRMLAGVNAPQHAVAASPFA